MLQYCYGQHSHHCDVSGCGIVRSRNQGLQDRQHKEKIGKPTFREVRFNDFAESTSTKIYCYFFHSMLHYTSFIAVCPDTTSYHVMIWLR
jgi:hypothetical protein